VKTSYRIGSFNLRNYNTKKNQICSDSSKDIYCLLRHTDCCSKWPTALCTTVLCFWN